MPLTRLKNAWTSRFGPIPHPERWAFFVGCYNSGTTLFHNLLARHRDVGSMPFEGQFYTDQLPRPMDLGLPRLWAIRPELFRLRDGEDGDVDIPRLKRQWAAAYNDHTRPVLLEKSPTNAARTRWLQEHFENAHFVLILRDGRAVAEGIRRKEGHDIRTTARQWRVSNEIMLEDAERLERWKLFRYEDLAADSQGTMDEICEFLGLSPLQESPENLDLKVHGLRLTGVTNQNQKSMERLSAEDLDVIEDEAGEMLRRLGYLP